MFAAFRQRLAAAADLAVEVSTLGEYGFGPEGFVELEEHLPSGRAESSPPAHECCPPGAGCDQATPLRRTGELDERGFIRMLERVADPPLFLRFVELDGSTEGKNPDPVHWLTGELRRRRRHSV